MSKHKLNLPLELFNAPSDPIGANGTLYYNTTTDKMRVYENGTWKDSVGGGGASTSGVISVSGTTNRITSTGGSTPVIDVSATFEALLGKVASPLSQFAATTSAQLASVISDETGSGALVFASSPTLVTPNLGTPSSLNLSNATALPVAAINSGTGASSTTFHRGDNTWAAPFTLTTTGSSGAATFTSGTLNIPQYSGGSSFNGTAGWATNAAFAYTTNDTASNGIVKTGNNFKQGGTFNEDVLFDNTGGHSIYYNFTDGGILQFNTQDTPATSGAQFAAAPGAVALITSGPTYSGGITSDQNGTVISSADVSSNQMEVRLGQDIGMRVRDEVFTKGLYYATDYSANYTDRSIVDKAYVDKTVGNFKVVISTSQIINSFSSPVTLVAAPGAGKAIYITSPVLLKYTYGGAPFSTAGANMVIKIGGNVISNQLTGTLVENTSDQYGNFGSVQWTGGGSTIENGPCEFSFTTSNPTGGGTGTITVTFQYTIVTL